MPGPITGGAAGVTNSASANAVPKSDGTNLVASRVTDDGTQLAIAGLPLERTLASTTVDTNVGTKQTLYTVPAGKRCVVTKVVVRDASANLETMAGALTFGFAAGADEWASIFSLLVDLNSSSRAFGISALAPRGADLGGFDSDPFFVIGNAADVFGCVFNDTAITATVVIDTFGYLY